MNLCTVFCWLTQTVLNLSLDKIAAVARPCDNANMGFPLAQLVVKASVTRAHTDVLVAKFAVSMREKNDWHREYTDTKTRLMALKSHLDNKEYHLNNNEYHLDNSDYHIDNNSNHHRNNRNNGSNNSIKTKQ